MQKRFVAWARVSSAKQKNEGFSLEDQEARLHEFAKRLNGGILKLFKIAETATRSAERETFREFTTFVKRNANRLDGMLFVKVDRAARNIRDWADLEALSESARVPLFFPDQPTAETPAGRMQRRMSAVFASYQTDQQANDIRSGLKRRVESGLPLGRQYGFRNVRVNGRSLIEIDPITAPKVKRIFELFAYQPVTIYSLIDALARQGIVYTDRQPRFTKSTIYRILTNRIYVGEVHHAGVWYPGTFDKLVDLATFEQVQQRLGGRIMRKPEMTYAGKLMCCGHCGNTVTGEKKLKESPNGLVRTYTYYRCSLYNTPGHPRVRFTEAQINDQLIALFRRMRFDDPGTRQWFTDVIKARLAAGQHDNRDHRVELERQRDALEKKMSALLEMRMDDEITQEEYVAKRRELHDRLSGIRVQLETIDVDIKELTDRAIAAFELSQSLEKKWLTADFATKRTILEIVLEKALLNSENIAFFTVRRARKHAENGFKWSHGDLNPKFNHAMVA